MTRPMLVMQQNPPDQHRAMTLCKAFIYTQGRTHTRINLAAREVQRPGTDIEMSTKAAERTMRTMGATIQNQLPPEIEARARDGQTQGAGTAAVP